MAWLGIWLGLSNTCDDVWSNGVGQNSKTNEKHDEDCVKDVFQLAVVKFERDGEGGREEWKNVVSIFEKDQYWS